MINYNAVPYRLIPADAATLDGCWINDNNLMTAIKSGRLRIERDAANNINYAFTLYDINVRLIESKVKEESVRLLRIK